jgi:hypothetical protein
VGEFKIKNYLRLGYDLSHFENIRSGFPAGMTTRKAKARAKATAKADSLRE